MPQGNNDGARNFRNARTPNRGRFASAGQPNDTLRYLKENPEVALRIAADAIGLTPPWMRPKPTVDDLKQEAAFAAASLIPVPGLGQVARGAKAAGKAAAAAAREVPRQMPSMVLKQRLRSAEAVERATGIPTAARPDALLAPTPVRPPARVYERVRRQPRPENMRFDDPRPSTPIGVVREELPKPPTSVKPTEPKPLRVDIPQGLRGADQATGLPKVRVTWDGTKAPNHQQFKKLNPETGRYVKWDEGFKQARNRWKTRQTKMDTANPNASDAAFEGLTPQQYARVQRMEQRKAEGLVTQRPGDENNPIQPPTAQRGSIEAARQEAAVRGYRGQPRDADEIRRLMEEGAPGSNPRPASRLPNPGQGADRARGSRPTRKEGEPQADFDQRLADWNNSRSVANLRKTKKSLQAPKRRKGESEAAYNDRIKVWYDSFNPKKENFGTTKASEVQLRERARVDEKLASTQPNAIRPDQLPTPNRPAGSADEYNPYAFLTRDLTPKPRPVSRPAEAPAAAAEGPKVSKPRGGGKKKTTEPAPVETPASAGAEGPKPKSSRGSGKPKADAPKQPEAASTKPKGGRKPKADSPKQPEVTPKVDSRQQPRVTGSVGPSSTKASSPNAGPPSAPRVFSQSKPTVRRTETPRTGSVPPSGRPAQSVNTPPRPTPPPSTAAGKPGPASTRPKGYLRADTAKAIKDRARNIYGKPRATKGQKFAVGAVAAGFPAVSAAAISRANLQDGKKNEADAKKSEKARSAESARLKAQAGAQQNAAIASTMNSTGDEAGVGQSKSAANIRKKQNEDIADGTIRKGRGGKYMRRYNAKTGRWDIVGATSKTAKQFLRQKRKAEAKR